MSSHSAQRDRDCLQAMGLTLYVARYPLPGAAPSPVLVDSPPAVDEAPAVEARKQDAPGRSARPMPADLLEMPSPQTAPERGPEPGETPSGERVAATVPAPFTLAAVSLGGALWLEDLPDAVLGRDQVDLMRAICRALDWPVAEAAVNQFAWPMHRNPQFDQGAEAARTALSAFVRRQLDAGHCSRLILLGAAAQTRLDGQSWDTPLLCIPSTRDMLHAPTLKREAWRCLRMH